MEIIGSRAEGNDDFVVFVDSFPSLRVEDAPSSVWTEARTFFGQRGFDIVGTVESN